MAQFSGAVKIADGFDDYLSPAQNCVLPMMNSGKDGQFKVDSADSLESIEVELALTSVSVSAKRKANSDIYDSSTPIEGANFGQIQSSEDKATITLSDCLACSGCVTSAETILITQQSGAEFIKLINDIREKTSTYKVLVVSVSPQSRASLANLFQVSETKMSHLLSTLFKALGAYAVMDTSTGCDLALLEACNEFESRYRNKAVACGVTLPPSTHTHTHTHADDTLNNDQVFGQSSLSSSTLPLLCSECPGWVCFAEKTQGAKVLAHMSSVHSPQQIMGVLAKQVLGKRAGYSVGEVCHVSIMPCYDKKLEAARDDVFNNTSVNDADSARDVDLVLATTEVVELLLGNSSAVEGENITTTKGDSAIQVFARTWASTWSLRSGMGSSVSLSESDSCGESDCGEGLCGSTSSVSIAMTDDTHQVKRPCCKTSVTPAPSVLDAPYPSVSSGGSVTPLPQSSLFRAPGQGGNGGYAEVIFKHACSLVGVTVPESLPLPWCAGTNVDLRSVSLEFIGTGHYIDGPFKQYAQDGLVGLYVLYGKDTAVVLPGVSLNATQALVPSNSLFKMNAKYKSWKAKCASYTPSQPTFNVQDVIAAQERHNALTLVNHPLLSTACESVSVLYPPTVNIATADTHTDTYNSNQGVCLFWFAIALGFRNIQNIVRQNSTPGNTYSYVEVMACPSGCLAGGAQIPAVEIPKLRAEFGLEDREAIAAGASLKAQKDLVSRLDINYHEVEPRSPAENPLVDLLHNELLHGVGSKEALKLLHTQFRALDSNNIAVVPKW